MSTIMMPLSLYKSIMVVRSRCTLATLLSQQLLRVRPSGYCKSQINVWSMTWNL